MKEVLKAELLAALTAALEAARQAHASAIEGATHAEAKAENDKDTRGLEQSYLARGQAQRIAELGVAVAALEALDATRLVLFTVEEDEERQQYLLAPHGGGEVLTGGVRVVTRQSPIGVALAGKRPGDDVEVRVGGKVRALVVVARD